MSASYSENVKKITSGTAISKTTPPSSILGTTGSAAKKLIEGMGFQVYGTPELSTLKTFESKDPRVMMSNQMISADGPTSAKLREYDLNMYNEMQNYIGTTGSLAGTLKRMESAFKEFTPVKYNAQDIREALQIFDYNYTPEIKEKIRTLVESDHLSSWPVPEMDLDTSAGLYFNKSSGMNENVAYDITPKKDIPIEVIIREGNDILEALAQNTIKDLMNRKPALFTLSLRSKEQVILRTEAGEKARPYYSTSYPINYLASSVFQVLQEAMVGFWDRKAQYTNASAYKFSFMIMDDIGKSGCEALVDWVSHTRNPHSIMFGDDSYFAWQDREGIKYAAPDMSHLDMSLGTHCSNLIFEHIKHFFLNSNAITPSDWEKSHVKQFIQFYTRFIFDHLVLGPYGVLFHKTKGFSSGLPGVTLIDMFAMSVFHVKMRQALRMNTPFKVALEASAKSCGFIVKRGTDIVRTFHARTDGMVLTLSFLGAQVGWYDYDLQPRVKCLVPYCDKVKIVSSMIYRTTIVKKDFTSIYQFCRLMGIALNVFMYKDIFTIVCATMELIKSQFQVNVANNVRKRNDLEFVDPSRFNVSIEEKQYMQQYLGKNILDIPQPTILRMLRLYAVFNLPTTIDVIPTNSEQKVITNLFTDFMDLGTDVEIDLTGDHDLQLEDFVPKMDILTTPSNKLEKQELYFKYDNAQKCQISEQNMSFVDRYFYTRNDYYYNYIDSVDSSYLYFAPKPGKKRYIQVTINDFVQYNTDYILNFEDPILIKIMYDKTFGKWNHLLGTTFDLLRFTDRAAVRNFKRTGNSNSTLATHLLPDKDPQKLVPGLRFNADRSVLFVPENLTSEDQDEIFQAPDENEDVQIVFGNFTPQVNEPEPVTNSFSSSSSSSSSSSREPVQDILNQTVEGLSQEYQRFSSIMSYIGLKNKYKDDRITKLVDSIIKLAKVEWSLVNLDLAQFGGLNDEEREFVNYSTDTLVDQINIMMKDMMNQIDQRVSSLSKLPQLKEYFDTLSKQIGDIAKSVSWGDRLDNSKVARTPIPNTVPQFKPSNEVKKTFNNNNKGQSVRKPINDKKRFAYTAKDRNR